MATQSRKDSMDDSRNEEYPKARRENGTFVLPWKGKMPSGLNAMKWFLTSPNNSNIPGSKVSFCIIFCYKPVLNVHPWRLVTNTLNMLTV